jgi:peptide/nickel transport system substrate-binding protein
MTDGHTKASGSASTSLLARTRLAAVVGLVLALLLAACGGADGGPTEEEAGEDVVIAYGADFAELDPQGPVSNTTVGTLHWNIAEGLVRADSGSGELVPVLATEWEPLDDTTWQFTLREGVTFHNGEPFNADAVVYSVARVMDEATQSGFLGYFPPGLVAEAVDEYTVNLVTGEPRPVLPRSLNYMMMVPDGYAGAATDPVGTGPYRFVSSTANEVVVEKNEDYWGEPGQVERFRIIARPEASVRIAGLQTGEIDIAVDLPPEAQDQVPAYTASPALEVNLLRLNALGGLTEDIRIREAIVLGTDRDALRESIIGADSSEPSQGQLASGPEVFGFNPDLSAQPFDPDRARELVEEAGQVGAEITLVAPVGRIVKGEEFAEALALNLEENTGLAVTLEIVDLNAWIEILTNTEAEEDVEAVFVGVGSDQLDLSQPISSIVRQGGASPRIPHDDFPRIQQLIDQADVELDEDAREELLKGISAELYDAHAFNFLYREYVSSGHQENVSWPADGKAQIRLATVTVD